MKTAPAMLAYVKLELSEGHDALMLPADFIADLIYDAEAGEVARLTLRRYDAAVSRLAEESGGGW